MAGVHAMLLGMGGGGGGGALYLKPNGVTIAAQPFVAKGKWYSLAGKDYYVAIDYDDLFSVVSLYKGLSGGGEVLANLNRDGQTKSIPLNQVVTTFVDKFSTGSAASALFYNASTFNQLIASWDTSSVTNISVMFRGCSVFNQDISGWNTGNVTNMFYMFESCSAFNQDISGWDTSNVTNMSFTFAACSVFNQPLGSWNTGNVTNMRNMFESCSAFNQPIGSWNTSNVTNMLSMFQNCTAFNQDISSWCVSKIPSKPTSFDLNTPASWTTPMKPNWGAAC